MDEKITLDRETFKTLASGSRIDLLKALSERRKTLSELSKELKMASSTTSEHLTQLVAAELIQQHDDGHKWKYYELTRKGRSVLYPGETQVYITLALAAVGFVGALYFYLQRLVPGPSILAATKDGTLEQATAPLVENVAETSFLTYELVFVILFAAIIGFTFLRLRRVRRAAITI
ncbi:MAG: winged helix-turn-helix domain-containing protein [Nanoarchaeota archaeon]|nr:winged helix-turn-helix domain-containing protein [Nanoarchaeota archaeon]